MTELLNALKDNRDTAPGGDQIKQVLLNHMGPGATIAMLELFNQIHLQHVPPPHGNRQKSS